MGKARTSSEPPEPPPEKEPVGIPPESSSARRRALPPSAQRSKGAADPAADPAATPAPTTEPEATGGKKKKPLGLKHMSTSARLRLELALDHDEDDEDPERPRGLKPMTSSARHRLELALEADENEPIDPPRSLPSSTKAPAAGQIPFDASAQKLVRSLMRWLLFSGLLYLTVGALTGLFYVTGPGSVAHVVVGILSSALSVWLLLSAWSFRRVLTSDRQQHHLVNGLGLLRSALLLKAILLFSAMALGCFTFSILTGLLLLL